MTAASTKAGPAEARCAYLWCHLAFWFPLGLATPLFVALHNPGELSLSGVELLGCLLAVSGLGLLASLGISSLLPRRWNRRLSLLVLSLGVVLAVQGNVVHGLFEYGEFNGEVVDWSSYGWKVGLEAGAFVLAIPLVFGALLRSRRPPRLIPLILIVSSLLLVAPSLLALRPGKWVLAEREEFDPGVFEFSSRCNLIHLLPDGLQGDIVREALEDHPEIAAQFTGFTLYPNHVGQFQGTAPTVPTILTGRKFDLSSGHDYQRERREIEKYSYPVRLAEAGFRLDFATPMTICCPEAVSSCVMRPLNDPESRGYLQQGGLVYSLCWIADLTLFRHSPMVLKQRIYRDGGWWLTDRVGTGQARIPDPIIRDWTSHMVVSDRQPTYKWYHFIGTHVPPRWNAECSFVEGLERTRENYKGQTVCVLRGIGRFLDRLKELGVYDQTAILISGDHGCNVPVDDLTGEVVYSTFQRPSFFGNARPALLVKPRERRDRLAIADRPTTMVDLAPTALDLVGLSGEFEGISVLGPDLDPDRRRTFHRYESEQYWTGEPVPYAEFEIQGDARDPASWELSGIRNVGTPPDGYERLSSAEAARFTRGLGFGESSEGKEYARVFGHEFAFLIRTPGHRFDSLVLELELPGEIDRQTVSLRVNGRLLVEDLPVVSPGPGWSGLRLPVEETDFDRDENFVRVRFREVSKIGGGPWWTSAAIRSIRFR